MTESLPGEVGALAVWLEQLEAAAASPRGRACLDAQAVERLVSARRALDRLSEQLLEADAAAVAASGAAEAAMAELVDAERSRAEARRELAAAVEARNLAELAAARAVRPVVELAQRRRPSSAPLKAHAAAPQDAHARQSHGGPSAPAMPSSGRISSSAIRLAAPAELAVTALPSRINQLSWRGAEEPGARYLIEAAVGRLYRGSPLAPESTAYRLIATVHDETTYQHAVGQVAQGVHVRYRLRVARESLVSEYSAEVTVACR
ncbi:hypothetical protein [Sorangium sp. So ce341]|uniref:hypothetical protein n=1 Tax=Sorangium sp. So ce341 TaxID=3133302 RepID=UPI003F60EF7F